jgi:hypothetical protein
VIGRRILAPMVDFRVGQVLGRQLGDGQILGGLRLDAVRNLLEGLRLRVGQPLGQDAVVLLLGLRRAVLAEIDLPSSDADEGLPGCL